MPTSTLKVKSALTLSAPGGETLDATDVRAAMDFSEGGALTGVTLSLSVTPEDWARVDAGAWFGLQPEVRGPTFAHGFHDQAPIEIEARLRPDPLGALAELGGDKWDVAGHLNDGEAVPDVHKTEAWQALHVKQERDGVKTGFSTTASGLQG